MFKQVLRGIALVSLCAIALGACAPAPAAAPAPARLLRHPPTEELPLPINGAPTFTSFSSPAAPRVVCLL